MFEIFINIISLSCSVTVRQSSQKELPFIKVFVTCKWMFQQILIWHATKISPTTIYSTLFYHITTKSRFCSRGASEIPCIIRSQIKETTIFDGVPCRLYYNNLGTHFNQNSERRIYFIQFSGPHAIQPWPGGRFKNTYELLTLRAHEFSPVNKIYIFQCMGKEFCVELDTLWNVIIPIHRKIWLLYNIEILRALMFKSPYSFFKRLMYEWSQSVSGCSQYLAIISRIHLTEICKTDLWPNTHAHLRHSSTSSIHLYSSVLCWYGNQTAYLTIGTCSFMVSQWLGQLPSHFDWRW